MEDKALLEVFRKELNEEVFKRLKGHVHPNQREAIVTVEFQLQLCRIMLCLGDAKNPLLQKNLEDIDLLFTHDCQVNVTIRFRNFRMKGVCGTNF